eukprot:gene16044-17666_t
MLYDLSDVPDDQRSKLFSVPKATSDSSFPRFEKQEPYVINLPTNGQKRNSINNPVSLPSRSGNEVTILSAAGKINPAAMPPGSRTLASLLAANRNLVRSTGRKSSDASQSSIGLVMPQTNQLSSFLNLAQLSRTKLPVNEPRPIVSSKLVDGTPSHFKDIVIGRCWDYQARLGIKERLQIDCLRVWQYFKDTFAYKGPCEVTRKNYLTFLEKIEEDVRRDKALLWTGCRELAQKMSDFKYSRRFTTLEDTLAGYLFTGLSWCGSKDPPGINYNSCPYECSIQAPYWAMANFKFAQKVEGVVHVLLNGTRKHLNDGNIYPSYLKDRYYFGPYVIPNLDSSKVTEVRILVAHTLRERPLESCGEASIKELQQDLTNKGIRHSCHDDPDIVKHVLCASNPMLGSCTIHDGYMK